MADPNWTLVDPPDGDCKAAADCAAKSYDPTLAVVEVPKAWITKLAPGKGPIYAVNFTAQHSVSDQRHYQGFVWKSEPTSMECMSCEVVSS